MELIDDKYIEIIIIESHNKYIHTLSGMESLMLDLVFKIIIGQITEIPKSQILFIDESISVLDKDRLSDINSLFLFLKQYYNQVFLITHMSAIVKNHINNFLEIKKYNSLSLVLNIDTVLILNEPDTDKEVLVNDESKIIRAKIKKNVRKSKNIEPSNTI